MADGVSGEFSFDRLYAFDDLAVRGVHGQTAGVDEVGRGPLAGPVVAAAVMIPVKISLPYLNDSKKVTPKRREVLARLIHEHCLVGIGVADESEIDTLNIYQASRLAMNRAIQNLPEPPAFLLVDGNMKLDLPIPQKAIIQGDQKSARIASASIVAKVYRDDLMNKLDNLYPGYGLAKHKGYGTAFHLEKIRELGPAVIHRQSFAPVREALVGVSG